MPAAVDVPESVLDDGAKLVAATLADRFEGKPISGSAIARAVGRDVRHVRLWLAHAEALGLVQQTDTRRGWIPATR
ncbi:hypothetical protein [Novipirellula artificiosorum]|uniref:hypothetical protein n=1 Tax=Novipirellula artificiosorum TaxID=2528016 RepID=UPI0011B43F2E|nr:hypothetical protein [Novipirellula artificiosorum]